MLERFLTYGCPLGLALCALIPQWQSFRKQAGDRKRWWDFGLNNRGLANIAVVVGLTFGIVANSERQQSRADAKELRADAKIAALQAKLDIADERVRRMQTDVLARLDAETKLRFWRQQTDLWIDGLDLILQAHSADLRRATAIAESTADFLRTAGPNNSLPAGMLKWIDGFFDSVDVYTNRLILGIRAYPLMLELAEVQYPPAVFKAIDSELLRSKEFGKGVRSQALNSQFIEARGVRLVCDNLTQFADQAHAFVQLLVNVEHSRRINLLLPPAQQIALPKIDWQFPTTFPSTQSILVVEPMSVPAK